MYFDMIKCLPVYSICYKCGKAYYRSNRNNGKCPVCLQKLKIKKI